MVGQRRHQTLWTMGASSSGSRSGSQYPKRFADWGFKQASSPLPPCSQTGSAGGGAMTTHTDAAQSVKQGDEKFLSVAGAWPLQTLISSKCSRSAFVSSSLRCKESRTPTIRGSPPRSTALERVSTPNPWRAVLVPTIDCAARDLGPHKSGGLAPDRLRWKRSQPSQLWRAVLVPSIAQNSRDKALFTIISLSLRLVTSQIRGLSPISTALEGFGDPTKRGAQEFGGLAPDRLRWNGSEGTGPWQDGIGGLG